MFETQYLSYLSTNLIFKSKCRSHNHKGTWVSCGCTFVVDIYQRYVFRYHSSSRLKRCLIKPVRPIEKTGQTGLAKSAGSRLQRRKRHCVRIDGPRGGELGFLFVFKTLM
jgi:hypothetical protein